MAGILRNDEATLVLIFYCTIPHWNCNFCFSPVQPKNRTFLLTSDVVDAATTISDVDVTTNSLLLSSTIIGMTQLHFAIH